LKIADTRLARLVRSAHRFDRVSVFGEIWLNRAVISGAPGGAAGGQLGEFLLATRDRWPGLPAYVDEAEAELRAARAAFAEFSASSALPFPEHFNADPSLAVLCYALVRCIPCTRGVEVGVGYGLTSRMILSAMARNGRGALTSIDLPPLADTARSSVGVLVSPEHRPMWQLIRGSGRRHLRSVLKQAPKIDLFISDGANVFTLQHWELRQAWPRLRVGGVAVLNNVGERVMAKAASLPGAIIYSVAQQEKTKSVTCIVVNGASP
jgi:predicted O-methyltransferase YrrM